MVLTGNKAKRLSSVNHTTKTIHHHHHHQSRIYLPEQLCIFYFQHFFMKKIMFSPFHLLGTTTQAEFLQGQSSQLHLRSGIDILQFALNFDHWQRSLKEANPDNFSPILLSVHILQHFEFFRKPLIFQFSAIFLNLRTIFWISCSCKHWTVCLIMICPDSFEKLRKPDIQVCL